MDLYIFISVILLIVLCETFAQSCANLYSHSNQLMYLLAGGFAYLLVVYFISKAHKYAPMGVVNCIWSGLSIIAIASVGYLKFNQKLNINQITWMGIILVGVASLSLSLDNEWS